MLTVNVVVTKRMASSTASEKASLVGGTLSADITEYAEKIRKIGVGKIVTGCVSVVVFVVATFLKSGDVYGMNKILYMTVAGAIMFILTGTLAIYVAKHPTTTKVFAVFYLGLIGLIYELIVLGFLIDFFAHHLGIFKDKNGKHMAMVVGLAALWTIIGAIKVIHGAVMAYYAYKTRVAHSAAGL